MKKVLALILVSMLLLASLAACKNGGGTDTDTNREGVLSQEMVDGAAQWVYDFNKPGENNTVSSSFTLPAKVVDYEGYDFDVEWTAEGGDGLVTVEPAQDGDKTLVKVDPYADKDTEFTLKGVVSNGDLKSDPISLTYVIKQFLISDWAYWAANTKDAQMNIKGVIVAKYPYSPDYKNTGVFVQDLDGEHGYFAYRLKCDSQEAYDTDLAIGNVVVISGTTSIYNGFREMGAGCTYSLVYDGNAVKKADVNKVSLDGLFKPETNLVSALDQYQGVICTITDAKITKIEWVKNTFETFEAAGDGRVNVTVSKNGVNLNLFLSTSCTLSVAELKEEYSKLGVGYTIDIVGPGAWNNEPQIYPCAGGITVKSTEMSDEDKIANELNSISLPASVSEYTTIELPVKGASNEDVEIAWAVKEGSDNAAIEDGKLILRVGASPAAVTLTATAKCGAASSDAEYKINLIPGEMSPEDIVNALYMLNKGEKMDGTYTLTGKIIKVDTPYNDEFKNVTVTMVVGNMTDKPVQCFRLAGSGVDALKVGDTITVTGSLKRYNDIFEFDAACNLDSVEAGTGEETQPEETKPEETKPAETTAPEETTKEEPQNPKTPKEILTAAYALEKGAKMDGTYTLSGKIISVNTPYDAGYDNVTVTIEVEGCEDKPIQCFRLKGKGADTIKKNDKITVTGEIKNYNGTIEFDAGCSLDSIDFVAEVTAPKLETPEQIVKALYALGKSETLDGGPYTLTGVITEIPTAYSDEYKNVTVVIVVDNLTDYPVTCYRLKGDGAENLKVGDTITVKGQLTHYYKDSSVFEFPSGCTIVK
ncbi:MAG: hypothetical protein J5879_03485 [Clostridia bacterium]|nr:hypothetical protein [Clostridia bacterium]